ncbi:MAG: methyl-accepting chemotaxis protein [Pelagimonas sp.]|jgi:methyl-accepting chemotaxis protein|nr:methyl-accepting chemotaxis protein [Pelagimonas sp.]
MSRFSIRVQVYFLATAFVVALLAVTAVFWSLKSELKIRLAETYAVFAEEALLAELVETLNDAERTLLLAAYAGQGTQASFEQELDAARALISSAPTDATIVALTEAQNVLLSEELASVLKNIDAIKSRSSEAFGAIGKGEAETAVALIEPLFRRATFQVHDILGRVEGTIDLVSHEAGTTMASATSTVIIVSSAGVIATMLFTYIFGRSLVNPISSSTKLLQRLAEGRYGIEVRGTDRRDEIGEIFRNVELLRDALSEAKTAQDRANADNEMRTNLLTEVSSALGELKDGKLDQSIEASKWAPLGTDYVRLCEDFNALCDALQDLVGSLHHSARTVEGSANSLAQMSSGLSGRAEHQAATLEQSAAALADLSHGVQHTADQAQDVDRLVLEGRRRAEEGGEVMDRALTAMSSIASSSEQITQIIDVIDDIAFQTNLLSLNAGVEAARAGESGRGFAVVASEVQGLAQRAAASASEIKELVLNSTQQVQDGEALVQQTSQNLGQIVQSVNEVSEAVSKIASSATLQAQNVQEVNAGVSDLEQATQENAVIVNQAESASQSLNDEATRLSALLTRFDQGKVDPPSAPQNGREENILHSEEFETVAKPMEPFVDAPAQEDPTPTESGSWEETERDIAHDIEHAPHFNHRPQAANEGIWKDF